MKLLKSLILFLIGGLIYVFIEVLYDGSSDFTMFCCGGLSLIAIGLLNEIFTYQIPLLLQMLIGAIFITLLELGVGLIFNSDYSIWYYSDKFINYKHQICLEFSCIWFLLSGVAIALEDYLRYWISIVLNYVSKGKICIEEKPHYTIWRWGR